MDKYRLPTIEMKTKRGRKHPAQASLPID